MDERRSDATGLIISVIIPTKDRPQACRDTVAALRDQTLPASKYEIVVVDDGSRPSSESSWMQDRAKCRLVRLGGRERSAARNVGAQVANADLLVFLDDDITVGSDFLAAHLAAHREWEGALVVGAIDLHEAALKRPFARFRQALERRAIPSQRGVTCAKNSCTAGNMSMARRQFLRLGGFDEALISAEDQDLALRHSEAGGAIVFLPEAVGIHRDDALDVRSYCRRVEWGSRHIVAFCRKHPAWPDNIVREQVNGPVRWGREPMAQSARKLGKRLAELRPILALLFAATAVVERVVPGSPVLERIYRMLLGVHIYRGYRDGARSIRHKPAVASGLSPKCG